MQEAWANSLDLHLETNGPRIRAGVEAALRDAVRSGRLPSGARLPSSRVLARDLGVARNTVADAYAQLSAEGWLTARTGDGTWVAKQHAPPPLPSMPAPSPAQRPLRHDLRPGIPDLGLFPRRAWLAATRTVLRETPDDSFGYSDPRGLLRLRAALAGYLARARGVAADPEHIVICAGFSHGLAVLGRLLRDQGADSIAVEGYGHLSHHALLEAAGLRLVLLPVDADGARPDALGGASAALLTPAHQFPLGVTMQPARRRVFADWASRGGGLVIEDDYDGEFRYDRQPVGAMQALAPERVVYAGTASKSLAPGLRLGWLVLPARLVDPAVAAVQSTGAASGVLDQLTLAHLLETGGYDRQVRAARLEYRRRRDGLVAALARSSPDLRVAGIAAGLHALVDLTGGLSENDVISEAAERQLALQGLGSFSASADHDRPALVIGYARPPEHGYTAALARLCAALSGRSSRMAAKPRAPRGAL